MTLYHKSSLSARRFAVGAQAALICALLVNPVLAAPPNSDPAAGPGNGDAVFVVGNIGLPSPPASDKEFLRQLNPKAREAFNKLSADEKAKALPEIRASIKETVNSPDLRKLLFGAPKAMLGQVAREIWSEVVYNRSDAKFNFCNVMLDREAASAYSEDGVKKLMATPRACPANVDLAKTLEYVNRTLACTIGDPAYTRVLGPEEAADFRQSVQGTKQAFKGGGIGLKLSSDPSKTLPLNAEEQAAWEISRAKMIKDQQEIDPCTGKTVASGMTAEELKAEEDYKPSKPAFTGLIYHVVKGSPAELAGVLDGDVITKVDGQNVIGLESNTVIDKMRGDVDTAVTITVTRGSQELTFTMKRKPVVPDTVWTRYLGDGIYAIVIESFSRNDMAFDIYDQVKAVAPKARGFVFDVRNNPGGIVDEAIEAVSWFVHDGVIFSQRERVEGDPANPQYHKITWTRSGNRVIKEVVDEKSGKVLERGEISFFQTDPVTGEQKLRFKDIPFIGDKPAVVLANDHSASAAEIFTGALSENRIAAPASGSASKDQPQGAIFIGVHTFGKFIGQAVMPGPLKTSVKATTFRYFTPRGEWLGDAWKVKIGLKADIEVKMPDNGVPYTATDAQLNAAKAYLLGNGTAGTAADSAPAVVKP